MAIVCWGNLAKTADDVIRIEQSIEDYVSGHNQNPNAHAADGYSLFEHRTQDVIDHTFYSVRNIFMYPQIRTYKAIVDPAGYGDLTDIQAAIDYVQGLGGGSVLAKAGTYPQTDNIVIPSNVYLEGEGADITVIDFNSTAKIVQMIGTTDMEEEILWSLPHDSKIITGTGTAFESHASAGDYFILDGTPYKIASVDSNTQITLQETFQGVAFAAITDYEIWTAVSNAGIKNLTIKDSGGVTADTGSGLKATKTVDCKIENVISRGNAFYGFNITNTYNMKLVDLLAKGNTSDGFRITNNRALGIQDCQALSNENYGFYISTAQTGSVGFTRCEAYHNDLDGFYLTSSTYLSMLQCYADYNSRDGIRAASGDWNSIVSCRANKNAGYGINISAAGCNEFNIVANTARLNTTGNFQDLAPDTHVGHNSFV